ncbi:hypothetical protein HCN44_008014 [Aphidius gifuensis]|uniref:Phosphatidic acid phosphatase type 2/haloperoxidase domain-containing protein n=1 Tax=Aphidius gifuensis TaxID=684658 RepID=A0A834XLV0_APHGI|nr:hypothetical protein HCN44_008014 [Aphidius gifuensis]
MSKSTAYTLRKIGLDAVCFIAVILGIIYYQKYAVRYQRGFFCDDESINHPYKNNTVSSNLMYFFSFGVTGFLIVIGEFLYSKSSKKQSGYSLFDYEIPSWMLMAYTKIGVFAFGAFVTVLIVDTAKYNIGRLRPHFLDVCRPNVYCHENSTFEYLKKYHTDFECTNTAFDKHKWEDARLSFPSGHSAYSMYGMLFFALYLQLRMTWKGSKLLRHTLQVMCLWMAWFTAMSRVSDYKHHWSDVLAGMSIGATVALINASVFCICDLFKERRVQSCDQGTMAVGKIKSIECDNVQ